jgi:hypothetical protein
MWFFLFAFSNSNLCRYVPAQVTRVILKAGPSGVAVAAGGGSGVDPPSVELTVGNDVAAVSVPGPGSGFASGNKPTAVWTLGPRMTAPAASSDGHGHTSASPATRRALRGGGCTGVEFRSPID